MRGKRSPEPEPAAPPIVQRFVLDGREHVLVAQTDPLAARAASLTPIEREVVLQLLSGASIQEIARLRGRSVRTISNQTAAIYKKLGVSSRAELAARLEGRP